MNPKKYEYKHILDQCQVMILMFSRTGIIKDCNQYAISVTGYSELRGMKISDIFLNEFYFMSDKLVITFDYTKQRLDTDAYRRDKTCFPVSIYIDYNESSGKDGILIATDLTLQKEARKCMDTAIDEKNHFDLLRNEFLANVTHELKTPINGIVGICSELRYNLESKEHKHMMEIILQSCNHMNYLISEFMDYSRIISSSLSLEESEFDFQELMNHIIDFNQGKMKEKDLRFLVKTAPDIPRKLIGDRLRLEQIINSLISNAVKFTYYGRIILEVYVSEVKGNDVELFIIINDTGIGIEEKDRERIFKSFTQGDSSATRKFGGTGLGLSICKELIELMHGSIHMESQPNKGSSFSFTVRLRKTDKEELSKNEEEELGYIPFNIFRQLDINEKDTKEDVISECEELIEKLSVSILMDSWLRADTLSIALKNMLIVGEDDMNQIVFKLCLAIRKENKENSLKYIDELLEVLKNKRELSDAL